MESDIATVTQYLMETMPLVQDFITLEARRQDPDKRFPLVQLRVMNILRRKKKLSLTELAAELGVKPPTASVMVVRMVKQKVITRSTDRTERRKIILQLTPEGQQLIETYNQRIFQRLSERMTTLSPEERETLHEGIQILHKLFQTPIS